jgi:hypothetical protein
MWALTRFLLEVKGRYPTERARAMLCPPSLLPDERRARDETFNWAFRTLRDLGLLTVEGNDLSLSPSAQALSSSDLNGFSDLLRKEILDRDRNDGLNENDDQTGPKDLVRALAWFLTRDPLTPLDWYKVTQLQDNAFPSNLGKPFVNDFRWNRFVYWAPVLGFASRPLLDSGGSGQKLIPDCTAAVRRTVLAVWEKAQRVNAADAVDRIIRELPVLPGGRYSRSLGLGESYTNLSSSLSFALLCGQDQGWISLGRPSDAAGDILLVDPDQVSGTRRVGELTIHGSLND